MYKCIITQFLKDEKEGKPKEFIINEDFAREISQAMRKEEESLDYLKKVIEKYGFYNKNNKKVNINVDKICGIKLMKYEGEK